jgi:hypothetical protein
LPPLCLIDLTPQAVAYHGIYTTGIADMVLGNSFFQFFNSFFNDSSLARFELPRTGEGYLYGHGLCLCVFSFILAKFTRKSID